MPATSPPQDTPARAADAPREIECKLDLAEGDAPALASRLAARLGPPAATRTLVSVYFDTGRHALRKHGLSLRIRTEGSARTQTIKRAGAAGAGLFDRDEWESPVVDDRPDLAAAAASPLPALLAKADGPLQPRFETRIARTLWQVERGGDRIEVALDRGSVAVPGTERPFAELEMELKHGAPEALLGLLREIAADAPLRIGVVAKSERGYALLKGGEEKPAEAEAVVLTADMTVGDAFQAIARSTLRQFRRNETLLLASRRPEALHKARVGMRRLRAALSLFKPAIAGAALPRLTDGLRDASRLLGEARNLDVYLEHAATGADGGTGGTGDAALLTIVKARREAAYDAAFAMLEGADFRTLMLELFVFVEAGAWRRDPDPLARALREQPVGSFAAAVLAKRWRQVTHKGRHLDRLDPHRRHRVRIAAKKLRYAAEFVQALATRRKDKARHEAFVDALEGLQSDLGALNDIATGDDVASRLTAQPLADPTAMLAAGHRSGEDDARIEGLLASALKARRRLADAKPFWTRWAADQRGEP